MRKYGIHQVSNIFTLKVLQAKTSALTGADFALFRFLLKLESRIDVAPGTFVKNNKHSPIE